jgi:Nif-specific regulatory protein
MLSSAVYQESLIEKALDLVVQVIQAERALFVKYNEENNGSFSIISARHMERQTISDLSSFSSGVLQKVIKERKACLYHDVQSDPDISQFESVQIHQIKSVMGVPVFHDKKIWGVILADSRQNRQNFSEDNLRFLEFFAHLLSLAIDRIIRYEDLEDENRYLLNQLQTSSPIPHMIGESTAMKKLAALIHKVARTDATVLILGESGTGKDLAARAIHKLSNRNNHPYLAQFCGSIPDTLLESELFGYKRGAFSGANSDKKGLFEVAQGGTFFLDEIADISLALQAKLLRVIQNKEIIPLGDTKVKKVDVRLIAATNADLKAQVKEGKFRQDLFYRLNVFPIYVPPLRERKDDIVLLVQNFINIHSTSRVKIDNPALKKLKSFHWPGNVRQLENTIQRALILCEGSKILPENIMLENEEQEYDFIDAPLKDIEKHLLLKRLDRFNGNRTLTAKSLGVSVRWVQLKLKEMKQ